MLTQRPANGASQVKLDKPVVLFTSEQGSQFPGCKWTNWDTGVHTALVARWPDHVPAGTRTDAIVQYADVVPTLIDLAGGQGRAGTGRRRRTGETEPTRKGGE